MPCYSGLGVGNITETECITASSEEKVFKGGNYLDQTVEHMYVRLSSDTKQLVNVRSTIWPNTIATMSASDNPIILKISRMTIARTAHIHNHQGLYLYTFIILCSGKTMTGPESSVDSTTFKAMTASEPNTSVEICCSFGSLFLTRLCP